MDPITLLEIGSVLNETRKLWKENWKQIKTEPQNKSADIGKHELLVLIADFYSTKKPLVEDPAGNLFIKLNRELKELNNKDFQIRVERLVEPKIITSKQAKKVSDVRKATVIIWGEVTGDDVRYEYIVSPQWKPDNFTTIYEVFLNTHNKPEQFAVRGAGGGAFIVYLLISILSLRKKMFDRSIEYASKAIDFAKGYPQVPTNALAIVYRIRADLNGFLKGQDKQALTDYNSAIKLHPHDPVAYALRGLLHESAGNNQQAFNNYKEAIKLDQKNVLALSRQGFMYFLIGDFGNALKNLDLAIKADPKVAFTYNYRGSIHQSMKQPKKAMSDYNKAIHLDRVNFEGYFSRSSLYFTMKKPKLALKDLDKAIEINPCVRYHLARGGVYYDLGNKSAAMDDFLRAKELAPEKMVEIEIGGKVIYL